MAKKLLFCNYIDKNNSILYLYDYSHKNKRGKIDNELILDSPIIYEYDIMDLYQSVLKYINLDDYSLPLDFIINFEQFKGFKIIFKDKSRRFFVNASFDNNITLFLGLKDVNGVLAYMDDKDFELFNNLVLNFDFRVYSMFDDKIISFIKNIPHVSKLATKNYVHLLEKDNLTYENYFKPLKKVEELNRICKENPVMPQIINMGNKYKYIYKY